MSTISDSPSVSLFSTATPSTRRNLKKLSIALPAIEHSAFQVDSVPPIASHPDPPSPNRHRRPSVVSLPAVTASLSHRRDEEDSPSIPYIEGPIQIIPGVWLGSEDNARDWKGLVERRIRSILNVAKEVVMPFDSVQPLRPFASTPNLKSNTRPADSTYYPAHLPSGRPSVHYLKLQWSHGQQDLVREGFPAAMAFTDAAVARGEGVLVHCQCGISRSATMVIALLMHAAAKSSPFVPAEIWELKGMQSAYAYVKEKSKWVSPNMSLIYQLLEYERTLKAEYSSSCSEKSSVNFPDEEEWDRRRRLLNESPVSVEHDDRESVEVVQEARALDKAMEDRIVARKSSESSIASSSGIGMGAAWRSRYGSRKRTESVTSSMTTGSTISEDLVEEEEASALLGVGGGFDDNSIRQKSPSELDASSSTNSPDYPTEDESVFTSPVPPKKHPLRSFLPRPIARQPPSVPASGSTSKNSPPPVTATQASFELSSRLPPKYQAKRRPAPLGITPTSSLSSEITIVATPMASARQPRSRKPSAPPHLSKGVPKTSVTAAKHTKIVAASTPSQTLFVFPPSPTLTTRTPSTMTLTSHLNIPSPFLPTRTPRVSAFRTHGRTRSFIGISKQQVPTTACSRVDARGWVGLDTSPVK